MKKSTLYFLIGWSPIILVLGLILVILTWENPLLLILAIVLAGIMAWFFWWCDKADNLQNRGE